MSERLRVDRSAEDPWVEGIEDAAIRERVIRRFARFNGRLRVFFIPSAARQGSRRAGGWGVRVEFDQGAVVFRATAWDNEAELTQDLTTMQQKVCVAQVASDRLMDAIPDKKSGGMLW